MLVQFITTLFTLSVSAKDGEKARPNPSKDDDEANSGCKVYDLKIADEYKAIKGTKPAESEVFKEATANGLVPISITTVFASPAAINIGEKLPDSLRKVMESLQKNDRTNVGYEEGQTYSFVGGDVIDALEKAEGGGKDSDKDKKDSDKDKEDSGEKAKEPSGGSNAASAGLKPKKSKLLPPPAMRPSALREQQDEASDSMLMQKDE